MRTNPSPAGIGRRRFIGISAAAAGLSLLPFTAQARAEAHMVSWRGVALGAEATIRVHHHDEAAAKEAVALVVQDLQRLEAIFSLYRQDSALMILNSRGVLEAPPGELVDLLEQCRRFHALTGGAFDPSVQPLWRLYHAHFSRPGADPDGPAEADLGAALRMIGFDRVLLSRDRIALRGGMALTLNGIAQGYITDRAVERLRRQGIAHTLVDLGESRALGQHPDGRPWQAAIADPDGAGVVDMVPLPDLAIATSSGSGFRFDPQGRITHILDPGTGRSPRRYSSVSVILPNATAADALSTAFSMMPEDRISRTLAAIGEGKVYLVGPESKVRVLSST